MNTPRKLIIPGMWLKIKVAWWRVKRRLFPPKPQIAWRGFMVARVVHEGRVVITK